VEEEAHVADGMINAESLSTTGIWDMVEGKEEVFLK
jgi:hypothetical protein